LKGWPDDVEQIDGLSNPLPFESHPEFEPIEAAERIADAYLSSGPRLSHGGGRAFYHPASDGVTMPLRSSFQSAHGYYSTLFHELAHSTGHKTRLDRKGITESMGFGSKGYADEELLAEFAASFLCGESGISNDGLLENQAAYIRHWLDVLKGDSRIAVLAAQRAQKAADYLLKRSFAESQALAA
jgi:antirestriction protein ArdC